MGRFATSVMDARRADCISGKAQCIKPQRCLACVDKMRAKQMSVGDDLGWERFGQCPEYAFSSPLESETVDYWRVF